MFIKCKQCGYRGDLDDIHDWPLKKNPDETTWFDSVDNVCSVICSSCSHELKTITTKDDLLRDQYCGIKIRSPK